MTGNIGQASEVSGRVARRVAATRTARAAWAFAGHVLVLLGVIGAFVPLMPTTVFLIMAASCYARSSERLYRWLLEHPWFGPVLRDWIEHRSMRARPKVIAIGTIVVAFALSFFAIPLTWVRVVHVGIGLALVGYLLRIPIRR
ncbi:MAG: YbaN family protein [Gemmatimonadales bacterium]